MAIDVTRLRSLNNIESAGGAVVYWMQRDQRVSENWALLYAQERALEQQVPLIVVFNLVDSFGKASWRQYDFMLRGLEEIEQTVCTFNIQFMLLRGYPEDTIPAFVEDMGAGELVCDFNPLRLVQGWKRSIAKRLTIRMTEVDAHNIVPCFVASDKQEYAAYTFRPKVHRLLATYLTRFSKLRQHPYGEVVVHDMDWEQVRASLSADQAVPPVEWLTSGPIAARKAAKEFIRNRLDGYADGRNDPNRDAQSNLSPYLHFGQLSAQWLAYEVQQSLDTDKVSREAFLEELIVRRELSDNYCFYNSAYDRVEGAHEWAQKTIAEHAGDEREYVYTKKQLETAATHDELWNAMQLQLMQDGKLHGWCRMYWAKKILEWTEDVQAAIDIALYLNDKYSLDGNDPNGVAGVMWSICGVHDRAWNERPVFGKVRYMNYAGAKRKFDVAAYIAAHGEPEASLFNE
jgi:deoxyribodipyrimidine photo-lyase